MDPTIRQFCTQNHEALYLENDQIKMESLVDELVKILRQEFIDRFAVSRLPLRSNRSGQPQSMLSLTMTVAFPCWSGF